jgi:hypothetical protein
MTYSGDKVSHIRPQDVELIDFADLRDVGLSE